MVAFDDLLLFIVILAGVAVVAVFLNKRLLTLLLSSVFLLLVAMRLGIEQMYLMGTVLLALPVASFMVGWISSRHLEVQRHTAVTAEEGETVPVRVDVHSPLSLFSGLIRVSKHLPRHVRLVPGTERIIPLPSGVRQEYGIRADRRGIYRIGGCTVSIHDPLGIFTLNRRFALSSSMIVYPTGLPMEEAKRAAGSSGGWIVQTTSSQRGDEADLFGTRDYRVGDDLRRIHWLSSARRGDLIVVEREKGSTGRVWIALDTRQGSNRGVDRDATLERGIKMAVTLMDAAMERGDAVGLLAPGRSGGLVPPQAGEGHRMAILEILARVQADGDETLSEAILRSGIDRGIAVAVITGAPTEDLVHAISTLRGRGAGVVAVAVEPPENAKPPAYPVMTSGDFTGELSGLGVQTIILPIPAPREPAAARAAGPFERDPAPSGAPAAGS